MNLKKFLNQKAVYWGSPVSDGYGGFTYAAPVEVDVRWSVSTEAFFAAAQGGPGAQTNEAVTQIISKAVILSETDFDLEGRLFLGVLLDLDSDLEPNMESALFIRAFDKIPTKKADQFLRKLWLV